MTITLPRANLPWTQFRVLVRHSFGAGTTSQNVSGAGWNFLPMQVKGQRRHGFEVVRMSRGALPFVGRAVIKLEYGQFADGLIGADATSSQQMEAGSAWNSGSNGTDIKDLRGFEIRIQATNDISASPSGWRTVWWGQCEYQEDQGAPGALIPMGTRLYHCVDGLQRANRWMMNIHGYASAYDTSVEYPAVTGILGYNTPVDCDTRISKNRGPSKWQTDAKLDVYFHCSPGSAASSFWTAQDAAEHALGVTKPPAEPQFKFQGYNGTASILALLSGTFSWPVHETDSALEVLCRICKRERGRGVVFIDWDDDSGAPTGPLTVWLTVAPQLLNDVAYINNPQTGSTATFPGATTAVTTTTVDLIGDHRAVAGALSLGDPYQFRYDYLETVGEPIEVACTLSYLDGQKTLSSNYIASASLAPRWSATELSSFRGASVAGRSAERYAHVYQAHGLPPTWVGLAGDGNGGNTVRIDYRCNDGGAILIPGASDPKTSPALVKILSDLPLYTGYDYSADAVTRWDSGSGGSDQAAPTRRRWMAGVRKSAGRYLRFDETTVSITARVDNTGEIWLQNSADESTGLRALSDTSLSALSPVYDYQNIWLTVGIRLPHRVRYANGDATGRRRGRAEFRDFHLWLGAPGCIWDIDTTVGDANNGWAAKRAPGGGVSSFGILRDDRPALAIIHALSWAWYGTDVERRSSSWSIKDCGMLASFTSGDTAATATTINYPKLGQLLTTLGANGEQHTINTPITMVEYDNVSGQTTWSTEWSELEVE